MNLYTIGFTKKTADQFFTLINDFSIDMLVDIRLNNRSQLAGFTKGDDLEYFLTQICRCKYRHMVEFAPTKTLLDNYMHKKITWDEYTLQFISIVEQRKAIQLFFQEFSQYKNVCLLCSEPTPEKCHRRLLAEMISSVDNKITVTHI